MTNKATIATPGAFSTGANTAINKENTKYDPKPTKALGTDPAGFRNLRGADRKYFGDQAPAIPVNGSVGKPPR